MNSHPLPQAKKRSNFVPFAILSLAWVFVLQTPIVKAQPTRVTPTPLNQQPNKPPFDPFEDQELKEFDALPKAEREAKLTTAGPLFPRKYSLSNLSTRVFVKGNSPLVIDYALQPNSTALLIVSTDDSDLYFELHESDSFRNQMLSELERIVPLGRTPAERGALLAAALAAEFLRGPEKARRQVIINLPAAFGAKPGVGKLSIQSFTKDPTDSSKSQPAFFVLYGIGLGNNAVAAAANIACAERVMANHSRSHALFTRSGGSTAVDQIILAPKEVNTSRKQKVTYKIHSQLAFNGVKAVFHRVKVIGNASWTEDVHTKYLGPISEDGWLQPRQCSCEWDGKSEGVTSVGSHNLEVRVWLGLPGGDWASAWSDPKRVRIN